MPRARYREELEQEVAHERRPEQRRPPEADQPDSLLPDLASVVGNRAFTGFVAGPEAGIPAGPVHPAMQEAIARSRGGGSPAYAAAGNGFADAKGEDVVGGDEATCVDARGPALMRQDAGGGGGGAATAAPAAGGGGLASLTATVPTRIRHTTTPVGMAVDRIPPRVDIPLAVTVSGWHPPMSDVEIAIENSGGGNGTATLDGAASASVNGAATVKLRGADQTDAGKGANLRVVAKHGGTVLARSNPFAVAAIPQNYNDVKVSELTGARRGIVVQDSWESDSGVVADLDKTEISELVEVTVSSGCFSGTGSSVSGYLPGDKFSKDTHSSPTAALTGPGFRLALQTCMFKDHRTGVTDIPMTKSGYTISRLVYSFPLVGLRIMTHKVGAAVTAKGIASAAGAGGGSADQAV